MNYNMKNSKILNLTFIFSIFFLFQFCNNIKKEDTKGLRDYADFPIGTAIKINMLTSDSKLQKLQKSNFNSITSASDMKMNRIMPREGV